MSRFKVHYPILAFATLILFCTGCGQQANATDSAGKTLQPETIQTNGMTDKKAQKSGSESRKQVQQEVSETQSQKGPRIKFEKVVENFGEVGPSTRNLAEFKFKNIGDELLRIKRVTKTCGCTPYELKKREYKPGEGGTLKVSYHAGANPGTARRHLYVFTNDKDQEKIGITIKANIVRKVKYTPKKINLRIESGKIDIPKIRITSIDGNIFGVKSFNSTGGVISADVDNIREGKHVVVNATADPNRARRVDRGVVTIGMTHPETPEIKIPFETISKYKISPQALILFNVEPGKSEQRSVWIINNFEQPVKLESIESEKGYVKGLNKKQVDDYRLEVVVEITPPEQGEKRLFNDTLYIDIAGENRQEVSCRGFYAR